MKIGIFTIQKSPNYGGTLQSYALYKYLVGLGYDCEIVDILRPTHRGFKYSFEHGPLRDKAIPIILRLVKYIRHKYKKSSLMENKYSKVFLEKFDKFYEQMRFSKSYFCVDELYINPPIYDLYITGSDQVWNPSMPYSVDPYFLGFLPKGARRISYASSIAINKILPHEQKYMAKYLSQYERISVREESAKRLLESFIDKEIEVVCDPSFLLSKQDWLEVTEEVDSEGYILLFSLKYNKELELYGQKLKMESGKEVLYLCRGHKVKIPTEVKFISDAGPSEFLGYIKNSSLVITDSFHGSVFSLIMEAGNVFTIVKKNNPKSSRVIDLYSKIGILNHIIDYPLTASYSRLNALIINKKVVGQKMDRFINDSKEYLFSSIKKL